jgi:hypothetical protein
MAIFYRKGSVNEADVVSRRPDFFHPDIDVHLRRPDVMFALWLVLSEDNVSADNGFPAMLKTAYSSCSYFTDEKTRWKGHGLINSSDGLYTYHDKLSIPLPAQDLRILLLIEYHDNVGHLNWHRLLATLLNIFWWERMSFDCKTHCSIYVVCNRAKPSRQGYASLSPLGVPNYPREIVGMDFVTDLPKSSNHNLTAILILVCHLTKIAHFVTCHKEITTKETADLFIENCYKLHGVPKVIVSDRDPQFVGEFWQSFMTKLDTKLNTSTLRHPQTNGLTERVNKQCKFCYVAIQQSLNLTGLLIYPWLNSITIALSMKLQNILRLKYLMAFNQLLMLIDC